ncbi:MAG: hypothetical protein F6K56_21720 [Moorea sp. SIO3G5]|nr:hypothetical protein [Moorena sp. SIO3G5]
MSYFKHCLITRFNIKHVNLSTNQTIDRVFEDSWIEERLTYFKNYCLPSVLNQNCNNFYWLVYLDIGTKDKYKKEFESLIKLSAYFSEVRYVDNVIAFIQDVRNFTSDLLTDKDEYLITTRLDSDDALHENAISRLQSSLQEHIKDIETENKIALNLLCGYQFRVKPFYELAWNKIPSNPFVSLVEKTNTNCDTVYTYFHNDLKGIKIFDITDNFYWLQTVHSINMTTDVIGWPTLNLRRLKPFGFDLDNIHLNKLVILRTLYARLKFSLIPRIRLMSKLIK